MAITFPVGFLFRPTDKEVIQHYLLKKQIGEELPLDGVIQERDVYTEEVLSEVFRSSETHVYFFTQLKKKYLKGSNHDRTVGKATWKSESVDDICVDQKTVIGKKRVLDYINPGSVGHRDWNMKEFSLDGVLLEIPQTSSDYVVCLLEKKEPAIKRDRQKNMQSKKRARGALENLPSGNSNYKRIKLPSKQNQQVENQQTESAPLVDEQVGLINGEAGVETLEQIMQYLLEPDSSMVDVDEKNVEQMMQYLLEQDSPLDSMPPLMEAKPAPTVDEDGGYPSGENEVRMQPSIPNQSLPSSNPEYAVADSIHCLASAPEITAIENDVGILEQQSIPPPESLPSDSPEHAILNSVIPSATPAPTVEPSYEYVSSDGLDGVLLELPQIVSSCSIRISSAPIDQQVASIHGEAGVESMVNVVATNTLAMLPPSASYDLFECTSMPPLVEGKPAATVNEEGDCTSRQQEIRMLPVEKSHLEYQPSVAAPEFLADDAVMDSIILLSTTVEGFAEDFIKDFIDYF